MDSSTLLGPETAYGHEDSHQPWPIAYQKHWDCSDLYAPSNTSLLSEMESGMASLAISDVFYGIPDTPGAVGKSLRFTSPVSQAPPLSSWVELGAFSPAQEPFPLDCFLATASVGRSQADLASKATKPGVHWCPRCQDKSFSRLRDLR